MTGEREGRSSRPPEACGRLRWTARTVVRNIEWTHRQGLRQLVEEHDIRPVHNTVSTVRRAQWRRREGVRPGQARAVFLVSVPRSGTNMIMRALGASPEVEVHNEGDRSAFFRYRLRPDPVIRQLVESSRHRVVLFKPLLDGHRIVPLLDELGVTTPPKALWAYRDVDGRVRSALRKFGPAAAEAMRDIAQGRDGNRWQALGLSAESLDVVHGVDWDVATPADGAAIFWYVRNAMFFDLGLDRRPDVLMVAYAALVRAPQPALREVCEFIGVGWSPRLGAGIGNRSDGRPPVPLSPRVRALCDEMSRRLDAAAGNPTA